MGFLFIIFSRANQGGESGQNESFFFFLFYHLNHKTSNTMSQEEIDYNLSDPAVVDKYRAAASIANRMDMFFG